LTVIELVPVFPSLEAVMVTGPPALTAVTRPFASTVAAALFDDHVMRRPVSTLPPASLVTADSCCVLPTTTVADGGLTVTLATAGGGTGLTVIRGVLALTDSLVAVIVAVPCPAAVTKPEADTVSTPVLLEAQVTNRPVRTLLFASRITALSCCVPPTTIGVVGADNVTVATGGGGAGLTTISGVVALTDSLVAVIVAVPGPAAVTDIVAPLPMLTELDPLSASTAGLLDTQVTVRPLSVAPPASLGAAVSTWVAPTSIGVVGTESVTLATTTGVTVIELVPDFPSLVAVIVVGPPELIAVTKPFPSTTAAALFDDHVTVRPERTLLLASFSVATSCCVAPTTMLAEAGLTVTVATAAGGSGLTVITGVVALTDSLIAVIVAVPCPEAVTKPLVDTVSTAVLLEVHATDRPLSTLPFASRVTALSC
jgi:hypothetical protein